MKSVSSIMVLVMVLAMVLAACGRAVPSSDGADDPAEISTSYEQQVLDWRSGRLERLLAPNGYLNQIGLFWLDTGTYKIGSGADNDIRLPAGAASEIGVFDVSSNGVHIQVRDGIEVLNFGEPVTAILIADDTTEEPVQLSHGSIAWTVIKRDGRFAIRVRDFEHPFANTFGPLPYFPIDASMRVDAALQRYDEPRIANVGTVIEGLGYHPESPGVVEFVIDGQRYALEAYASGDRLFFVFGDATNRDDTYGAGRFLYADLPGDDGQTVMDFNRAYSPPCAFNDFSTCPVASPRNRLPIRVEAGEKYDAALHYSADTSL
ncbi:MAG: DUF1684 domain-containing protein [Woeseiaceae bacterium]